MKPPVFEYTAVGSIDEAVAELAQHGDQAKLLAGGQSLVPTLALRLTAFDHLVDLRRVEGIGAIDRSDGRVRIGAGVTQATIEGHPDVATAVPLLARATPLIGHFQIRNRGTIGGSLAHADPAAEYPAVALALDAELEILGPTGARTVAASEFFVGVWSTVLAGDELLTAVSFPVWSSGKSGFAVEELAQRHGDFALAGACVGIGLDPNDRVERCAIGLFGLGPTPVRASAAEAGVAGVAVDDVVAGDVGRAATEDLRDVPSDVHAPAAYRRQVGAVMVARALRRAVEEARSG